MATPEPPRATASTPATARGVHRFRVGPHDGWILADGTFRYPASGAALGAPPAEVARLAGPAWRPPDQLELQANVMLLRWGRELVLIDAGCGPVYGPTLGHLETNLRAAGFAPDDVTLVVFTHLHRDHFCGVADRERGTVRFPRARLLAAADEIASWRRPAAELAGGNTPPEVRAATIAGIQATLALVGDRLEAFTPGDELRPGFSVVSLPGHTPNHVGFRLRAGGEELLNTGDVFLDPRLHVPHPEWLQVGDALPEATLATRRDVIARARRDGHRLFCYHAAFPALGRIEADANGSAVFAAELT